MRFGLEKRLADATGLPVRVANDPAHATIEGCGVVIGELNYLSKHRGVRCGGGNSAANAVY